ncbi:MAG: alanine--glyoxylate aminotransferase family protein [Gemmatimonadota bacterium]|nr:MAG: alanine--glyoxylate aminotransferase family protein [Gemmatimonadota bacterium]
MMNAAEFGRFFLPGPTEVHPEILQAMMRPMIAHRGQQMVDLLASADNPLRELFCTERAVLVGTCAATGFMEMAVRSGVRHRALCLVGGAFGERFAAIVDATGRDVIRLNVPLGNTIEPDMLEDALRHSDVDAVTVVHSETSTGALAPLQELAEVVHSFDDVLLLVDGVTSIAGLPVLTDDWGLDFVFTGSQKALALPPGLALGAASERMVERARRIPERGAYLDVVAFQEAATKLQPTNTPALSLLYALIAQLDRIAASGGITARWDRHEAMRKTVEEWISGRGGELGFGYLPDEDRRSWTISCLEVPQGRNGREIAKAVAEQGWTIGSGYGSLKERTIRIGHMGDHTVERLVALLDVIEGVLR